MYRFDFEEMLKKILITGGSGFVGSSLAIALKTKYPSYEIICLDNLKRNGSELNIPRLKEKSIQFVQGDIRNKEDMDRIKDLTCIIDAAAEPSVLAGLNGSPEYLIDTNLMGTINCLYLAQRQKADFIFLSTSRIYPIDAIDKIAFDEIETRFAISEKQTLPGITKKGIAESFPIQGHRSFYGATKLSSELLIEEFNKFYGLKTVVNRCGMISGPWQMGKVDQGVLVLWVACHYWAKDLSYIGYGGKGKQVRDVLHVNDLFTLVDHQMHHMEEVNGKTLNVGGGEINVSLQELTLLCREVTGKKIEIRPVPEGRQADIRIYITDNTSVNDLCHWEPKMPLRNIVRDIFDWISEYEEKLRPILLEN